MPQPLKREPIPGYVITERIGVGGYGEVWSAEAPGGLTKAIKFVYGYFDDSRAARELKALDRIKQVRHPFLLSLERFEVVDGQLIIVTELAEASLKERFEQARQAGANGIPRDELLNYLRDAADALDYMSENFSLQHLDVKPENLLLVGGRMKVADFGLVKNLHDAAASMMGGLTPIYAAPEVFDDRPSSHSDQYSLAIVYQEMLTGHLPFPGRTPAQLAAQHLHASPRLGMLPPADQLIVAQSLAKNPVERFPNSRALVDALVEANKPKRAAHPFGPSRQAPDFLSTSDTASVRSQAASADTDSRTQILGGEGAARLADAARDPTDAFPAEPVRSLEPLETAGDDRALRPTLFLGIGGTAGRALRRLRRRLNDRFGAAATPCFQMLLIDTDAKSLLAVDGPQEAPLGDRETLAVPLRSARDYTSDSRNMMQWLSRRWLYSIPRSLQTEGRRPLGRLALVDHSGPVVQRLRAALTDMTGQAAVEATAAATGAEVRGGQPRVFVVASVSGGTGSGMALDLVHAVYAMLARMGLPGDGVCQILTHSTDRNPTAAELATANAYAFLTELGHYHSLGYNAAGAAGLPQEAIDAAALANTYFVQLGHGLNEQEFAAATEELAAYLYLASATPAARLFDRCRAETPASEGAAGLRSFSLATIGGSHTALVDLAADQACREVVDRWRGAGRRPSSERASVMAKAARRDAAPGPSSAELARRAIEHAEGLGLALAPLQGLVAGHLEQELGGDAEAVFARLRSTVDEQRIPAGALGATLSEAIREWFDPTAVSDDGKKPPAVELHAAIEAALKPVSASWNRTIADWIVEFVNDPAARVPGALAAKQGYANHLRALETECGALVRETQTRLENCRQMLAEAARAAPRGRRWFGVRRAAVRHAEAIEGLLLATIDLRIEECTLHGVARLLRLVGAGVAAAGDAIKDVQHQLGQWSAQFDGPAPWCDDDAPPGAGVCDEVRAAVVGDLRGRLPLLISQLDDQLEANLLLPQGGLRAVCAKADAAQADVLEALRSAARTEILAALAQFDLGEAVFGVQATPEARQARWQGCLEAARPKWTDCGGAQRLVVVLPDSSDAALDRSAAECLSPAATVVRDKDAELVLCYEQQQLSLPHVAARLIDGRNDIIQVAGRLHTRVDIPWSQLPRPMAECAAR